MIFENNPEQEVRTLMSGSSRQTQVALASPMCFYGPDGFYDCNSASNSNASNAHEEITSANGDYMIVPSKIEGFFSAKTQPQVLSKAHDTVSNSKQVRVRASETIASARQVISKLGPKLST